MKKSFLLSLSALSLSACGAFAPHSMPTGYTYHHDTYKSATTPESPRITTEQRQYMDANQAAQFREGVHELLTRLTARAGMPPKPVYVMAPDPMTTFYANIDNDLRESMRSLGYAISDMPSDAYVFVYDAALINQQRGKVSTGSDNVELTIKVFNSMGADARLLSTETGRYFIRGAEALHIFPSQYDTMPSYYEIKKQVDGFDVMEDEPRTATQISDDLDTLEKLVMPKTTQPVFPNNPKIPLPAVQPRPNVNYEASRYTVAPSQAVDMSAGRVSYDYGDVAAERPTLATSGRGRVSKVMNY